MLEDISIIYEKFPYPYNIFGLTIFVSMCIYYLFTFQPNKIPSEQLNLQANNIRTLSKIILLVSFIFSVFYFSYDNFYSPDLSKDKFIVSISPFYLTTSEGFSVDINTPNKIKQKIEESTGDRINVLILDTPPITNDQEAINKGTKVGANLVIYGGDMGVIADGKITELYIVPTDFKAVSLYLPFLDHRSNKVTISPIIAKTSQLDLSQ